jgi:hypothetical protein
VQILIEPGHDGPPRSAPLSLHTENTFSTVVLRCSLSSKVLTSLLKAALLGPAANRQKHHACYGRRSGPSPDSVGIVLN